MESKPPTANCCGYPIYCPTCKGPTKDAGEEYGGLAGGGDYEMFHCLDPNCAQRTIYVELPD